MVQTKKDIVLLKNWRQILQDINRPTTVLILDFETFFDQEYNLKYISTVEYVCNPCFAFTGLGTFELKQPFDNPQNCVFSPPEAVERKISYLQAEYGSNFENCTLVGQNLMFDALILYEKFGIMPKYTVDVLNLARHEDSRRKNHLKNLCKYYLKDTRKGDLITEGLQWGDMSPTQQEKMANYCRNDIVAETELFKLLLPKLSNPEIEISLADHTLKMYLNARLNFDFQLAKNLQRQMENELAAALDKVSWVLDYEN